MSVDLQHKQSCSVAYMLLFFRQQSGKEVYAHTLLRNYLQFCLDQKMLVNKESVAAFNQQRTTRQLIHFSMFISFYEQMGSPALLSTKQLSEMPRLGAYRISELIQYWYWPPWRTKAEEIGQGRGLLTWWNYLGLVDNTNLSLYESVNGYLKHEFDRGVSAELISQRMVVIRRWARWIVERKAVLQLDSQTQQQLHLINKSALCRKNWTIEQPPKWDHNNPLATALHLDKVVPLLHSLLRRGIPLLRLRQIRVRNIHSRYFERSTIELDTGLCFTLKPDDIRCLRVYLEISNRWQWPILTLDDYLFAEADWDTLWELSRQHLRLYRESRQYIKARRRALPCRTWPIYFRQNRSGPLASSEPVEL